MRGTSNTARSSRRSYSSSTRHRSRVLNVIYCIFTSMLFLSQSTNYRRRRRSSRCKTVSWVRRTRAPETPLRGSGGPTPAPSLPTLPAPARHPPPLTRRPRPPVRLTPVETPPPSRSYPHRGIRPHPHPRRDPLSPEPRGSPTTGHAGVGGGSSWHLGVGVRRPKVTSVRTPTRPSRHLHPHPHPLPHPPLLPPPSSLLSPPSLPSPPSSPSLFRPPSPVPRRGVDVLPRGGVEPRPLGRPGPGQVPHLLGDLLDAPATVTPPTRLWGSSERGVPLALGPLPAREPESACPGGPVSAPVSLPGTPSAAGSGAFRPSQTGPCGASMCPGPVHPSPTPVGPFGLRGVVARGPAHL